MNSYLAEILFSFYIITSNGGDLHTFPAFLNSQQERMSQEKPEKQPNSNQPKQISTQQSNVNQPRHNPVQEPRQKETIIKKLLAYLSAELSATFFTVVRLLIPATTHVNKYFQEATEFVSIFCLPYFQLSLCQDLQIFADISPTAATPPPHTFPLKKG